MKFALIDQEKARWPVEVQCEVLGVRRSGYYAWKGRPAAPRSIGYDSPIEFEMKFMSEKIEKMAA